jgi:hypothetical protein
LQDPPKFTKIGIFWFEKKPSGNTGPDPKKALPGVAMTGPPKKVMGKTAFSAMEELVYGRNRAAKSGKCYKKKKIPPG